MLVNQFEAKEHLSAQDVAQMLAWVPIALSDSRRKIFKGYHQGAKVLNLKSDKTLHILRWINARNRTQFPNVECDFGAYFEPERHGPIPTFNDVGYATTRLREYTSRRR